MDQPARIPDAAAVLAFELGGAVQLRGEAAGVVHVSGLPPRSGAAPAPGQLSGLVGGRGVSSHRLAG